MLKKTAYIVVLLLFVAVNGFCASSENLFSKFKGKSVDVTISENKNQNLNLDVNPSVIGENIKNELSKKKAIRFSFNNPASQKKITIQYHVLNYLWTTEDPVEHITGVFPMALDTMTKENYAKLDVDFKVIDQNTNKTLWNETITSSLSDVHLQEDKALPELTQMISRSFVQKCFGRKKLKNR